MYQDSSVFDQKICKVDENQEWVPDKALTTLKYRLIKSMFNYKNCVSAAFSASAVSQPAKTQ